MFWLSFLDKSPGQVYSALRRIQTTKSQGTHGIPNKVLKTFAFKLAPAMSDIYNSSMFQGTFPENLKRSFVLPITKVSSQNNNEEDLRPMPMREGFTLESLFDIYIVLDKLDQKQFSWPNILCIRSMLDLIMLNVQLEFSMQILEGY
jgi:hypothetical protein